jgi:peptide/nickel transport system ATP-binding protein
MAGRGTAPLRGPDVLLRVEHLVVEYRAGRGRVVSAVADVSFDLRAGETLGLVGESGCGKSTLARAVLRLAEPAAGSIRLEGVELTTLHGEALRQVRPRMQMVFQDPLASLNPRRRVAELVGQPLATWGRPDRGRTRTLLEAVGLDPAAVAHRRPRELSGGQAQRVAVARALALEPVLLVCDEPVSAVDVSVRAQILNLLADMRDRYGLTMLFVAHDLAVVEAVSDRVAVMYLGKLCEIGPTDVVYRRPAHPYTAALLAAAPVPDPDVRRVGDRSSGDASRRTLAGEVPSPVDPPSGCRFRTRCPRADQRCADEEPEMRTLPDDADPGRFVACHHPLGSLAPRGGADPGH